MHRLATLLLFFIVHVTTSAHPTHHVESTPKITVIGAGLAGLTAAYRLQKMGHPCEVYEARQRAGGRVCTAYFGQVHEELGGKNIYDGGEGKHILALIEELGLGTEIHHPHFTHYMIQEGKLYSLVDLIKNAPEPNSKAFHLLKEKIDSSHSLAELMDAFLKENTLLQKTMKIYMAGWEGSHPDLLDAKHFTESFQLVYKWVYKDLIAFSHGEIPKYTICSVAGGNSQLIERLAENLEIHYGMPLRKISRTPDHKIWLQFDNASIWTDYLILALPCSTLRDVAIEEGLFPQDQLLAIQTLQYGTSAKILFPIHQTKISEIEWCLSEKWHAFVNKEHSVMTWFTGEQSGIFNHHSPEDVSKLIAKEMPNVCTLYPDTAFIKGIIPTMHKELLFAQYQQPVGVSWVNEEFSKGGYSNYAVGTYTFFNTFIEDYEESVRKVFRSIDGRIFFAGEHTAPKGDNGTLDGAVNSGERAARMIHKAIEL